MGKMINDMIGAKIQRLIDSGDYWQVITDNSTINVFNPAKYYISQGNCFEMNEVHDELLLNAVITDIEFETEKYLRIIINDKARLEISLNSDDYNGPEAISIYYNTGDIVVFN
jgi:hypothetical protein